MARKGKFGRAAAGTQNLSSLVYTLLRQERDTQERTMITAYGNNMRSGTGTGTFTTDGTVTQATAAQVVAWYKAQAATARASGDAAGAASFDTQAEEFRISALKDMEALLDTAYQNGNAIDLSLLGGSGTMKVNSSVYEQYMRILLGDASSTESDKQRLNNKIFSVAYNKSAEDMVNGFNEKKYTAQNLVDFYDKELAAARANGLTEESKTYRDILAARASAVARAKSDGLAARQEQVNKATDAKGDELARDMQTLLKGSLPFFIMDKNTMKILDGKIGDGGGYAWMSGLTDYLTNNNISMSDIMSDAASRAGWDDATLQEAVQSLDDAVEEIKSLNARGYGKELGGWTNFITRFSAGVTQGAFAASTRQAVVDFTAEYGRAGGSVTLPGSAEPKSGAEAVNKLIAQVSGVDPSYSVNDIGTTSVIAGIGTGDISGITGGTKGIETIDGLLDALVASTGGDRVDAAYSLSLYLDGIANHPERKQSGAVADFLNSIGMNGAALLATVGPRGTGISVAQILAMKIQTQTLPAEAEKSGIKSMAYVWTPMGDGSGAFTFRVMSDAEIRSKGYALGFNSDGSSYYSQRITSSTGTGQAVEFIAVPGGGGQEIGEGYMDSNDLVVMTVNGKKYKFTAADIESLNDYASKFSVDSGGGNTITVTGDFTLPKVTVGQSGIDFVLSSGTINAITQQFGVVFGSWYNTKSKPGSPLYDPQFEKRTFALPDVPVVVGVDKIDDYAKNIRASVYGAASVEDAIAQYFKTSKILDPKGDIARQLALRLRPSWDNGGWKINVNGQEQTYTGAEEQYGPPIPTTPPVGSGPGPNDFASTDPFFGIRPPAPQTVATGAAGLAAVPGQRPVAGSSPAQTPQDYMQYTLRRLGPEMVNPEAVRPVIKPSNLPAPAPTVGVTPPGINPTNPGAPRPTVSMRPDRGSTATRMRNL